jgi:SAM-dependent methyltransferase
LSERSTISSTFGAPDPRALLGRVFGLLPRPLRWRIERWRWQKAYGRPFPLAERFLNGLKGIEIGGAAHNHFVDAINVDRAAEPHPAYIEEQLRLAGRVARIDLVAFGDDLPFKDKAVDFVLASHVIEHFYDPIKALREWERVARRYIFLVVPHHERTFDSGRPLTPVSELVGRHASGREEHEERHWSVWDLPGFLALCKELGFNVVATEDPDSRLGNGFAVVIALGSDGAVEIREKDES